jgi:hypothetical protein
MGVIFPATKDSWGEQLIKVLKYFLDALKLQVDNLAPVVKATTGHPSNPFDGMMEINTFDNKIFIYADSDWRQIVSW